MSCLCCSSYYCFFHNINALHKNVRQINEAKRFLNGLFGKADEGLQKSSGPWLDAKLCRKTLHLKFIHVPEQGLINCFLT